MPAPRWADAATGRTAVSEIITIMIIIAVSQGIFLGMVLLFRKKNLLSNKILAMLFFAISLGMSMNYFKITGNHTAFYYLVYVNISFYLLYGPLMYLYTLSITGSMGKQISRYTFHFLPFSIFIIYMIIRHRVIEWDGTMDLRPFQENTSILSYPNLVKLFLVIILVYIYRSIFIVRRYKQRLKYYFSDVEKIRLIWLSFFLAGASVFVVLLIILLFRIKDLRVNYINSGHVLIILCVYLATIYISTFLTIRYPEIFSSGDNDDLPDTGDRAPKYEKLRLDDDIRLHYMEELMQFMKLHKPYLRDSLTLRDLADLVKIPHHHLSIIINTGLNQNFYMFINTYRVDEARKMLIDPQYRDVNILNIAFNSGFNSKTTFNTVFKQVTGMTPTEFRKSKFAAGEL